MIERIFYALIGILFSIYIVRETTKQKLLERDSLVWLMSVVLIVLIGVFPEIIDWSARILHINYGPSLLFLLSILLLAALLLRHSRLSSGQQAKINELGHKVALLEEEIQRLTDGKDR